MPTKKDREAIEKIIKKGFEIKQVCKVLQDYGLNETAKEFRKATVEVTDAILTYLEEEGFVRVGDVEINEFMIKDIILDYDTKINGAVLCSDEYMEFVRGISKAIAAANILKVKK